MIKHQEVTLWTKNGDDFAEAEAQLREKLGMVDGRQISETAEAKVLVYEDDQNNGIWRVHLCPTNPAGASVYFRYWGGKITPEAERDDPMSRGIKLAYSVLNRSVEGIQSGGASMNRDLTFEDLQD